MKKSDLKTGMIVENRKGSKFLVVLNFETTTQYRDVLISENGWDLLESYREDLSSSCSSELDIVKVYGFDQIHNVVEFLNNYSSGRLIWKRDDAEKRLQMQNKIEELEKQLNDIKLELSKQ